ncbi:50S ribosomal protein L11 [candidate division NPL-UPA2 bacterium Unc8]|uniref:Large ribosomal subunit protein uL11 n=1 Tax=candidate division NPL-UPA2 bacterium Unc8 TaxID=1980939 RepID=A0A399FYJ7_UNCN2|nr:50S ribosomal protein L11 [Bacillota bacterium]MBT9138862.1 50S ribosomal protein L11 [Bacillota bacterium]MBT9146488.1 50S ribosomal protein L11 [Bacillota bacterium]RII00312.1 MAG: 50S ribosomal protein L11 [candidate division NPL-UPA2 bacterium Unc8]
MAKQVIGKIKLQILAGKANPAPPIGPALGQHGVNIMEFCQAFNSKTQGKGGVITPVVITVYHDRTFSFIIKSPPASALLKRAASIAKASSMPGREKIAQVSKEEVRKIAEIKLADLNAVTIEGAVLVIEGTARSMGIEIN